MRDRELRDEGEIRVQVDVRQPDEGPGKCRAAGREREDFGCIATLGDGKIESVVLGQFRQLPEGTRLYGQVWTSGEEVVIRYTRAVVPSGEDYGDLERDFPICVALGHNGGEKKLPGSKPGAAVVPAERTARFIHGQWP
jgi:serine/threonine-protein kinase